MKWRHRKDGVLTCLVQTARADGHTIWQLDHLRTVVAIHRAGDRVGDTVEHITLTNSINGQLGFLIMRTKRTARCASLKPSGRCIAESTHIRYLFYPPSFPRR